MFGIGRKATTPAAGIAPALESTPIAAEQIIGEALVAQPSPSLPPQDSSGGGGGVLYIATGAAEGKLKKDLDHRASKEDKLGRQVKATTMIMKAYDFINETIHSGNYKDGETIRTPEISLGLYGRTKSDTEQKRRDKAVQTWFPAVCGAFNERQYGKLTLVPSYDQRGRIIGVKVPATVNDRDVYLNKLQHAKAVATGKVVRLEDAHLALPSNSPVKLLTSTTKGVAVEVGKLAYPPAWLPVKK